MCLHSWHIKDHTHQFIMFIIANLLIFFPPYFFPVLFQTSRRLKSNVLNYQLVVFLVHVANTVHVPCGISIQTSPVWLPLDGWGARMRDRKVPNMNCFNAKED